MRWLCLRRNCINMKITLKSPYQKLALNGMNKKNKSVPYIDRQFHNYWQQQRRKQKQLNSSNGTKSPPPNNQNNNQNNQNINSPNAFKTYSRIQHFDILQSKSPHLLLQMLNYNMKNLFPLVDFGQAGLEWSLASQLCRFNLKQTSNDFNNVDDTNAIQVIYPCTVRKFVMFFVIKCTD